MMLEETSHNAHYYSNPIEALNKFRQTPDEFHRVFTDLRMRYLPGEKLTEEIRSIDKDIPIIIITTNAYMMIPRERKN